MTRKRRSTYRICLVKSPMASIFCSAQERADGFKFSNRPLFTAFDRKLKNLATKSWRVLSTRKICLPRFKCQNRNTVWICAYQQSWHHLAPYSELLEEEARQKTGNIVCTNCASFLTLAEEDQIKADAICHPPKYYILPPPPSPKKKPRRHSERFLNTAIFEKRAYTWWWKCVQGVSYFSRRFNWEFRSKMIIFKQIRYLANITKVNVANSRTLLDLPDTLLSNQSPCFARLEVPYRHLSRKMACKLKEKEEEKNISTAKLPHWFPRVVHIFLFQKLWDPVPLKISTSIFFSYQWVKTISFRFV